jgi:hypothetical protein
MGSLGGSSETKVDKFTKEITKELMAYGKEVGKIPYQPWAGLDVAAPNAQMDSGMQAFADMGNAFGMGMPTDVTQGRPNTYTDASGAKGYSGFPAFMQNLEANKNTPAAQRYSEFYDLKPADLYGNTNLGSVTGVNPVGTSTTPGGKGGGGGGTAYFPSGGNSGDGSSTGGKGSFNSNANPMFKVAGGLMPFGEYLSGGYKK